MEKLIEITLRYNAHTIDFYYNTQDINAFLNSLDYKEFVKLFGCELAINKAESIPYIIATNTILICIYEEEFVKGNFKIAVNNILTLFNVENEIKSEIINSFIGSIPQSDKKFINHSVLIKNYNYRQKIDVEYLILSSTEKKEFKYYIERDCDVW